MSRDIYARIGKSAECFWPIALIFRLCIITCVRIFVELENKLKITETPRNEMKVPRPFLNYHIPGVVYLTLIFAKTLSLFIEHVLLQISTYYRIAESKAPTAHQHSFCLIILPSLTTLTFFLHTVELSGAICDSHAIKRHWPAIKCWEAIRTQRLPCLSTNTRLGCFNEGSTSLGTCESIRLLPESSLQMINCTSLTTNLFVSWIDVVVRVSLLPVSKGSPNFLWSNIVTTSQVQTPTYFVMLSSLPDSYLKHKPMERISSSWTLMWYGHPGVPARPMTP